MTQDLDSLVPVLVEAVLQRLGGGATSPAPSREPVSRRFVWAVAGPVRDPEPLRVAVEVAGRWAGQQVALVPPGSKASATLGEGVRVLEVDGSTARLEEALAEAVAADFFCCAALSWNQAAELTEVTDGDPWVRLCLEVVASGRPVSLLAAPELGGLAAALRWDRSGLHGVEGPLGRRSERLARELERFGLRWVQPGGLARLLADLDALESPEAKALGGLVSQRTVREAYESGVRVLTVAGDTVVTPLARDEARRLGVEIRRSRL